MTARSKTSGRSTPSSTMCGNGVAVAVRRGRSRAARRVSRSRSTRLCARVMRPMMSRWSCPGSRPPRMSPSPGCRIDSRQHREAAEGDPCPASDQTDRPHPRVGVLVVAYNAATTLAQTLDRLPESFVRHRRPRARLRRRQLRRHLRGGRAVRRATSQPARSPWCATRRTSATAATRRPATRGRSTTASTSSCCCTATASTPRSSSRTSSRRWPRGEADAVFGSRMMHAGAARAGRHAALQATSATRSSPGSRTA